MYIFAGIVFVLLGVFVLPSSSLDWWGAIVGWPVQQTTAGLAVWLLPPIALCAHRVLCAAAHGDGLTDT